MTESDIPIGEPIEEYKEEMRESVAQQLQHVGIHTAFRRMDMTDVDLRDIDRTADGKYTVAPELTVSADKFGFEIADPDGPEDLYESLMWNAHVLENRISAFVLSQIDEHDIETVSGFDELDDYGMFPTVVLPNAQSGPIGPMPMGAMLAVDGRIEPSDRALVVDTDKFGYRVTFEDLNVMLYEESPEDDDAWDVIKVQLRCGYSVQDPDAAWWVDIG